MSTRKAPCQGDKGGGKHREALHRSHVRWLDKQEAKEAGRIDAVTITGSTRQLARQFSKMRKLRENAFHKEYQSLASTSLKDIVK